MKKITYIIMAAVGASLFTATTATAKAVVAKEMYIFGFAASFNDTIVHFTDIQRVDSTWIDTRTDFLLGRDNYSNQLRNYIADKLKMPHRTCITIYANKRSDIEKKYIKMMKLYNSSYNKSKKKKKKKDIQAREFDIRYINQNEFHYSPINMSQMAEQLTDEAIKAKKAEAKKAKKARKLNEAEAKKQRKAEAKKAGKEKNANGRK